MEKNISGKKEGGKVERKAEGVEEILGKGEQKGKSKEKGMVEKGQLKGKGKEINIVFDTYRVTGNYGCKREFFLI